MQENHEFKKRNDFKYIDDWPHVQCIFHPGKGMTSFPLPFRVPSDGDDLLHLIFVEAQYVLTRCRVEGHAIAEKENVITWEQKKDYWIERSEKGETITLIAPSSMEEGDMLIVQLEERFVLPKEK